MSDPFVQHVAGALAAIPHGDDCEAVRDCHVIAGGGYELDYRCTCDREQRIAQRVAAMAAEMRFSRGHIGCAPMCEECKERALRALSSPAEGKTP